jgi:excisionase family DNA binding protein
MRVVDSVLPKGFVTKEVALERLGVSEATLERMAADKRVGSKLIPRHKKKAGRIYVEADLDRLKREKEARRVLRPPSATKEKEKEEGNGAGGKTDVATAVVKSGFTFGNLRELLNGWRNDVGVREKIWLTWEEASELSGIPLFYVRQLTEEGKIHAERFGRSWRVLRTSLETFTGNASDGPRALSNAAGK